MVYFSSLITVVINTSLNANLLSVYNIQVIAICREQIEETGNIKQVKLMIFLLHSTMLFRKLDSIRKQYCGITTQLVHCSTLLQRAPSKVHCALPPGSSTV